MKGMEYAEHSYIKNKKIPRIFYGTAIMPFLEGEDGSELLDAMYDLGVNAFDFWACGADTRSVGRRLYYNFRPLE